MFRGSIVAIVTPFKDGKVDEEALRELIEFQIKSGTDGIVPCGTTGESATLSHEEHDRVIEITVDTVKKRVPVIAGTGSNSTIEAIRLTRHAYEAGVDGTLLVTPYYNKPTQEGLYQHYKAVAEAVPVPIVLYNVPGRTGINLLPETDARLSKISNIAGIKEASGDLKQISKIVKLCSDEFFVLSGDDFTVLPILAVGGRGVISVVSNIIPEDMAAMIDAFDEGSLDKAKEFHY
ncbi:MAG: 4-hydroxy-tetrahydrodipicolinate synthase, partial [Thermodesulfobacteriota bacterium]|nr:4-hydroxy-tetrahydrodipicolinate synthase [Thermodesulfobacteriota bacterium]